ncbi:hypothetical protein [Cyanobium sp. Morenito 9A2]|uniref:hypothetical protein n=1 Tax=Cyanobium sp. Morenito 9A2 TaxID=2823718 RepID=UPI0020CEB27E|nr:hypothetical protein [Cyanobium sp. Morenito 9A2]MCP9850764.1 hypothetical protein [Cyanobium sp. Morenito 9A2]
MAPTLLFITGVLTSLIIGFVFSRLFSSGSSGEGHGERRLLEERLLKADQGLEKFSLELQSQQQEAKAFQDQVLQARESAVGSRTQLESIRQERETLILQISSTQQSFEQTRSDRESLGQ